jgi:hypothetical protein
MFFLLATVEIFTPIIESAATAIGAGIVIGGFVGASGGAFRGWSRKKVERNALRDSYIGATWVLALWVLDRCIVYATSI